MANAQDKPPKTIGVPNDVWRELKMLSFEREESLGETIRYLLKQAETEDGSEPGTVGKTRKKQGDKSGGLD